MRPTRSPMRPKNERAERPDQEAGRVGRERREQRRGVVARGEEQRREERRQRRVEVEVVPLEDRAERRREDDARFFLGNACVPGAGAGLAIVLIESPPLERFGHGSCPVSRRPLWWALAAALVYTNIRKLTARGRGFPTGSEVSGAYQPLQPARRRTVSANARARGELVREGARDSGGRRASRSRESAGRDSRARSRSRCRRASTLTVAPGSLLEVLCELDYSPIDLRALLRDPVLALLAQRPLALEESAHSGAIAATDRSTHR